MARIPGMPMVDPNDPNAVIQFAIGPLQGAAAVVAQAKGSLPELFRMYYPSTRTFIIKKAGIGGRDDWRCYDAHTGRMVFNSHHPGKNPYEKLDPLGMQSPPPGGEWESVCDVSGHNGGFKIRPKKLSMHGRQYIKVKDKAVLSVAKKSKLKTMSLAKTFSVFLENDSGMAMGSQAGSSTGDELLVISSDLASRTVQFRKPDSNELVAIAQKTTKTLILNAALGVGSELQLEVAAGVDCTMILAAFLGLQQCGEHIVKDAFGNFVYDPLQDHVMDEATDIIPGGKQAAEAYTDITSHGVQAARMYKKFQTMMNA
ncbi:hypothetical protein DIPPA_19715 [Diplonema papillatum]|nr:hypothetical protein DIPPA_19715 [Diplonema papillatum]